MNASLLPISGPTQSVFIQLDPLLKSLLQDVATYRELTKSIPLNEKLVERWIFVVQSQVGILGQLSHAIQNLNHTLVPGLVGLATYIALPLTAIFHISEDLTNDLQIHSVVASHLRNLQQSAAATLLVYVEAISPTNDGETSGSSIFFTSKHVLQFLVALTTGIPYKVSDDKVQALDDGTNCWLVIIRAIQAILYTCPRTDLRKVLERNLVVRLVDCATSLLTTKHDALRLESLQVMINLMTILSDDSNLWQSIFPGILADVYKCLGSCQRDNHATEVQGTCLQCIGQLLVVTLRPFHEDRRKTLPFTGLSTTTALLQKIQLQAAANNPKHMKSSTATKPDFLSLVLEKAAIPLSMTLKQSVTSTSVSVRLQILYLCQVILVEAAACWTGTSLSLVALECCLILQNDAEDDVVTRKAESVLSSHRQQVGSQDGLAILTKIRSMVEELSVFAEGGKALQLKLHLHLLKGYVRLLDSKDLVAMSFPYRPFIQLMEVDFAATTQSSRPLPMLELDKKDRSTPYTSHQSKLPFRRLSLENAKLAEEVLEAFGAILGHKQAAYAIDSILADMWDAWSNGKPTISMCQEWGGSLVVATKIMLGAFQPVALDGILDTISKKADQKRRKILLSLASTVFPLLLNPPMSSGVHPSSSVDKVSPATLQMQDGFASIMILSLEFCSAAILLLANDVESLVSIILYPMVEKAHVNNPVLVQQAARDGLRSLAYVCKASSLSSFLYSKATQLLAEMQSCLRIPGGGSAPDANATETLEVAASLVWVLEELLKGDGQRYTKSIGDDAILSSLIEVCNLLMNRLDSYFVERKISERSLLLQTKLYSAIFRYLTHVMDSEDKVPDDPVEESLNGSVLEKQSKDIEKATAGVKSDDQSFPSKLQDDIRKVIVELSSKIHFRCCYLLSNDSLHVQISSCDTMTVGFQLLALVANVHEEDYDAEIRNAVFRQVAVSWPSIKARLSNVGDKVHDPGTSITSLAFLTEAVSSSRGSRTKKELATERFFLAGLYQLVASMFECSEDFMADRFVSHVWPLLAKHFSHFLRPSESHRKSNQWRPMVEEVTSTTPPAILSLDHKVDFVQRLTDSERHLLLSMERCLARVFACPDAHGSSIVRIHQAVGLVLLPFMGTSDEEVASTAEKAIKNIVSQDGDVLRRPLLELSGRDTSPHSISVASVAQSGETRNHDSLEALATTSRQNETELLPRPTSNANLASRCEKVLRFMETLPNQEQ